MGSSHSAPRRAQGRRRNSRTEPGSMPLSPTISTTRRERANGHNPRLETQSSFSTTTFEEELPTLVEEVEQQRYGPLSLSPSVNYAIGGRMSSLSMSPAGVYRDGIRRSLRPEEMNDDDPTDSFSIASGDNTVGNPFEFNSPPEVNVPTFGRASFHLQSPEEEEALDTVKYDASSQSQEEATASPRQLPRLRPHNDASEQFASPAQEQPTLHKCRPTLVSPLLDDFTASLSGQNEVAYTPLSAMESFSSSGTQQWIQHLPFIPSDEDQGPLVLDPPAPDFFPQCSRHSEWMGRSLETLLLGYCAVAPILCLSEDEEEGNEEAHGWGHTRRRSTCSSMTSRRGSLGSVGNRRGSLVGAGHMHGGTLANYYSRRRGTNETGSRRPGAGDNRNRRPSGSNPRRSVQPMNRMGSPTNGPTYRRRLSMSRRTASDSGDDGRVGSLESGPNIALSLLARETTGRLPSRNRKSASKQLHSMGGQALFSALDRPAGGMCSEAAFLSEIIACGDWAETQNIISRLSARLIGDPAAAMNGLPTTALNDPNLPPTASPFYAGGGRVGLERDAFVLAGGVEVLIRVFREPSFVGAEMARTYDARDLSEELVANRLAPCWNDTLASLRELVYAIPSLVESGAIFDDGEFVPFLFTLLSHDSCFDSAAALIEEILSLQSHALPQHRPEGSPLPEDLPEPQPTIRLPPPNTFFLGNVPDLYRLWGGFNCRQLAHFCRILALVVFEPEDRQLLESPAVLKSIELLQLRRNRAARAGRDSTVDMNQAILLGDEELTQRLLKLLQIMNFAPSLRRSSSYHVMAHFPFIADTLVMLGLNEIDDWDEIDGLETLARSRVEEGSDNERQLHELGSVAEMLENLADALQGNQNEIQTNQLGHIINVISAAQQAGVVVGRPRQGRSRPSDDEDGASAIDGLTSAANILTTQVSASRYHINGEAEERNVADGTGHLLVVGRDEGNHIQGFLSGYNAQGRRLTRVLSPEDAANSLQFNALTLGPYQVEVLFVVCTLLGGRRKIDAQEMLKSLGVIPILEDMFQRLPWDSLSPTRHRISQRNDATARGNQQQESGIHGPGCECTPESALCVQYLRLLHNFCDRDCDNYGGRRLLLSDDERKFVFGRHLEGQYDISSLKPGLLSKIIAAFVGESDESPYRFWLASCVESYLRGSSSAEQIFVARTGLLKHLISDITSQRLHCAGSLQTSFDILGELCKGNAEVLRLLTMDLDEDSFRRLMSVTAANLVDSNVFIRSLLLSLERISCANNLIPLHLEPEFFPGSSEKWKSNNGIFSRSYLTHSWWDTCLQSVNADTKAESEDEINETGKDAMRSSDWFPSLSTINTCGLRPSEAKEMPAIGHHDGVGHFGWVFTPAGSSLSSAAHAPDTVERLSWFLAANQTRLLRDLLGVVDLRNINHENICCLNTAVVVTIFAFRRKQLDTLLQDLKRMNDEECETKLRAVNTVGDDSVIHRAFTQAMQLMDIDRETPPAAYSRRASLARRAAASNSDNEIGDKNDVLRNFREVLWFWTEYYTHRGRDRLSLEFSSHLRFQEWIEVVALLGADSGAPTSLVRSPVRLPRSPYQRAARVTDGLQRSN